MPQDFLFGKKENISRIVARNEKSPSKFIYLENQVCTFGVAHKTLAKQVFNICCSFISEIPLSQLAKNECRRAVGASFKRSKALIINMIIFSDSGLRQYTQCLGLHQTCASPSNRTLSAWCEHSGPSHGRELRDSQALCTLLFREPRKKPACKDVGAAV